MVFPGGEITAAQHGTAGRAQKRVGSFLQPAQSPHSSGFAARSCHPQGGSRGAPGPHTGGKIGLQEKDEDGSPQEHRCSPNRGSSPTHPTGCQLTGGSRRRALLSGKGDFHLYSVPRLPASSRPHHRSLKCCSLGEPHCSPNPQPYSQR